MVLRSRVLAVFVPLRPLMIQADFTTGEEAAAKKASRSFKKYTYRGVELDQLLDLNNESFIEVSAVWMARTGWTCLGVLCWFGRRVR